MNKEIKELVRKGDGGKNGKMEKKNDRRKKINEKMDGRWMKEWKEEDY